MRGNVKSEDKTNRYYKGINKLLCASHWVDSFGVEHKLSQGLKIYYQYRKMMCDIFTSQDKVYYEKHTTVAKVLGLSADTIKRTYNPMLKAMGLIQTHGTFKDNNVSYTVFDLDALQGDLVNYHLKDVKQKVTDYHGKTESFTLDNMKTLEHNKRMAKRIRLDSDTLQSVIPQDRLKELLQIEREYKKDSE